MNSKINTLDVRGDFRSGKVPFDKIQDALSNVGKDETLRLLVPFEPVPLFGVAAGKGLDHKSKQLPEGDWEVLFSHYSSGAFRTTEPTAVPADACGCGGTSNGETIDVDARGLEPPQPMVRILETLARLPQGAKLRARTDRRPIHLYPHLAERGFTGDSEEQSDGSFITNICRA